MERGSMGRGPYQSREYVFPRHGLPTLWNLESTALATGSWEMGFLHGGGQKQARRLASPELLRVSLLDSGLGISRVLKAPVLSPPSLMCCRLKSFSSTGTSKPGAGFWSLLPILRSVYSTKLIPLMPGGKKRLILNKDPASEH